jgi:heparan-alpha-glucosaminide N-acetyltransferase
MTPPAQADDEEAGGAVTDAPVTFPATPDEEARATGVLAAGEQAAGAHARAKRPHRRVLSLDSVRGILLLVNIAVISVLPPVHPQLKHAAWFGVTFFDVVFPLFVTFSGVGLAFAHRNHVTWRRTFRRSGLLLLIGLAYTVVVSGNLDPAQLRFTGPLQVYAILVLVIGALHLVVRRAAVWAAVTVAVAAVHAFLLAAWQAGCPGGQLAETCNPSRVVDVALLGVNHVYGQGLRGHDPEGIVSSSGALLTALVGVTAGHIVLAHRGSWRAPALIAAWAAPVLVLALAASVVLPAMKRLWTTPFALGIAGVGVLVFALGIVVLDMPATRLWERVRVPLTWPLVALGRNSLLVYFGSHLVMHVLLDNGGEVSWAQRLSDSLDVIGNEALSFMLFMMAAWVAVTALLHRRRIYLRP